jgi:hypothetical protein
MDKANTKGETKMEKKTSEMTTAELLEWADEKIEMIERTMGRTPKAETQEAETREAETREAEPQETETQEAETPRRGRPRTGKAQDAATRKAVQRDRDALAVIDALHRPDCAELRILKTMLTSGQMSPDAQYLAWVELGKRNGWM